LNENQLKKSLNLPIAEVPVYFWEPDLTKWASVDAFGAIGDGVADDTSAIQNALDSGKSVVYFPKAIYNTNALNVPGRVKHLIGFYGALVNTKIHVKAGDTPLLIEDFGESCILTINHDQPRTLILSHLRTTYFSTHNDSSAKVFLNNCGNLGKNPRAFTKGKFWARFINTEFKTAPNFSANGVDMWVLGYKVEGKMTNFEVLNKGRLEVLGGICNEHGPGFEKEIPIIRNVDSSVCYVGATSGPQEFNTVVEETRIGVKKTLMKASCPPRGKGSQGWDDIVIPMYVSY
ncbi:MAG: hypothetical protein EOO20_23900, partial [Chryseobacterium sp.]